MTKPFIGFTDFARCRNFSTFAPTKGRNTKKRTKKNRKEHRTDAYR